MSHFLKPLSYLRPSPPATWLGAWCPVCPLCVFRALVLAAGLRLLGLPLALVVVSPLATLPDPAPRSSPARGWAWCPWSPGCPGRAGAGITCLSLCVGSLTQLRPCLPALGLLGLTAPHPGPLPRPTRGAALGPGSPLGPVRTFPVIAALILLPLPWTQAAGLSSVTVRFRGLGYTEICQ